MKKHLLAIALLVSLASAVRVRAAESKWLRMHTPNFDVISSASEKETRNTLQYFEQVREFFLKFNGHAPTEPAPVTIVIFGSEKEYAQYRPAEDGKKLFSFKTAESISVVGKADGKADLLCGPQDVLVHVKVSYEKSAEAGVDGILRVLEFEP